MGELLRGSLLIFDEAHSINDLSPYPYPYPYP